MQNLWRLPVSLIALIEIIILLADNKVVSNTGERDEHYRRFDGRSDDKAGNS
jgi:hypothetical protein